MKTKEINRVALYSSDPAEVYGSYDEFEKAYQEFCADNDEEPTENGKWDWFSGEDAWGWESCEESISEMTANSHNPFLLVGSCGTWRGNFAGGKIGYDLLDLIKDAINRMDDVKIELIDGAIELTCHHHDGTNRWTIHALNLRAESAIDKYVGYWKTDRELHEKLDKSYYWKKLEI
jgi:hypothetical protein